MSPPPTVDVRLEPFRLPLARPLTTAVGHLDAREGVWVVLRGEIDGAPTVACGEAAPLPGFSATSLADTRAALRAALTTVGDLAQAIGAAPGDAVARMTDLPPLPPEARTAAEQALLTWAALERGVPLARVLAPPRARLPDVAVHRLIHDAADALEALEAGATTLKLKIGLAHDGPPSVDRALARVRETVEAVHARPGGAPAPGWLRLDANRAFAPEQAAALLVALGVDPRARAAIAFVEEPVAGDAPEALAAIRALSPFAVVADERCRGAEDLAQLVAADACDGVVLKPGLVGGLVRTVRLGLDAAASGRFVLITTLLGSAVDRAGAAACATALGARLGVDPAAPVSLRPCGLDTARLLARDLGDGPDLDGAVLRAPTSAGARLGARGDAYPTAAGPSAADEVPA